jgi:hypothetical protein
MKRIVLALAVVGWMGMAPMAARAHDAYDDSQAHPLRIAAYLINPIGFTVEWLVTRPFHFMVSQPQAEPVFGHTAHESPFGNYPVYAPEDE